MYSVPCERERERERERGREGERERESRIPTLLDQSDCSIFTKHELP